MHSLAFAAALPLLLRPGATQDTVQPTTLHFFPRTSCNTGTSLSYTTVADLYTDSTCHTTPIGTEALYVDGLAEGCAVMAYSDSACSQSALLSQSPITAGTCFFYGESNSIGAWMGVCGAEVDNVSISTSMGTSSMLFSTMSAPPNTSTTATATATATGNNATMGLATASQTRTRTPGLQSSGAATSGVAGLREEDWAIRMMFKALLMMGSAEVVWAFI